MKTVIVDLSEWRTRLTLEALKTLDDKWTAIIGAAAAKGDEDTAAAFGNNLMMLMTLRAELEELATNACIPNIADLSPEINAPASVPEGNQELRQPVRALRSSSMKFRLPKQQDAMSPAGLLALPARRVKIAFQGFRTQLATKRPRMWIGDSILSRRTVAERNRIPLVRRESGSAG